MSGELQASLESRAREICDFFDFLNLLDKGILLSVLAAANENNGPATTFVNKLKKKKKYQEIPLLQQPQ